MSATESPRRLQVLTFSVGGEYYAIDVHQVREVVEALPVTRVPSTAPVLRGVVNLRGSVVPLLDLGQRFGVAAAGSGARSCIVVAELSEGDGGALVGLLVEAVSRVVDLAADEVAPPPPFGGPLSRDFVKGVVRVDSELVLLLDVNAIVPVGASPAAATSKRDAGDRP